MNDRVLLAYFGCIQNIAESCVFIGKIRRVIRW